VLSITPRAGLPLSRSIAQALTGRRLLIVVDNCEHVLDAAADLLGTVLAETDTVKILVTSREGLRVPAEHLWPVPSLAISGGPGAASPAVELFVERARAVDPGFDLASEPAGRPGDATAGAVEEICRRLDGIALAIELAAARMVSMSPADVRDRLGDRFRLLGGGRRGLERHQTLRHAVAWSYDLLDDDERRLLNRCSVFADGFDLRAVNEVCGEGLDEYVVLDLLDSLVRKSLVTTERVGGRVRYGMLETIRQFAEDQLVGAGGIEQLRDRHARFFAEQAVARWELWDGPGQPEAIAWVETEFANLRVGFRWSADRDLSTAAAIAAHTVVLAYLPQRFEAVGWAEELLTVPAVADLPQLPRLYTAASFCQYLGSVDAAIRYAEAAVALEDDMTREPFQASWSRIWHANAERFAGRVERFVEILADVAAKTGTSHVWGVALLLYIWPVMGGDELARARAIAEETMREVRAHGNPFFTAMASIGYARAFATTDLPRARTALRDTLVFVQEKRLVYVEALVVREAAALEATHGDVDQALDWFDAAIDSLHRAGNLASLTPALAYLTAALVRMGEGEAAATVYGTITYPNRRSMAVDLPAVIDQLRAGLGEEAFERCVARGSAMEHAEAVHYARGEIARVRSLRAATSQP
jgi:predicted ATPase